MADYKNMPRQRGLSDNPLYETNPRRFARARCNVANNAADRIIMYMGEVIQTYTPEGMLPTEAVKIAREVSQMAQDKDMPLDVLFDVLNTDNSPVPELGRYGGYILFASLIMSAAVSLRESISELRSSI